MGQNNQKDQKGPKMTAAVMLVQNNQNNQKIWFLHISHTILKVRFFWDTLYVQYHLPIFPKCTSKDRTTCRMSGREGVRLYKALHRTVQRVFRGDRAAMFAARDKVTPGIFCYLL